MALQDLEEDRSGALAPMPSKMGLVSSGKHRQKLWNITMVHI
jgi:hypothetical protein